MNEHSLNNWHSNNLNRPVTCDALYRISRCDKIEIVCLVNVHTLVVNYAFDFLTIYP